jgi:predicted AlkP superfamily pyrophosphatase or phosphodiesterase
MNAERVILFVVDGMRPDGMLQAQAPVMQAMMRGGAYSLSAQTVMPSVTLPTHMSMFHGLLPEAHGTTTNQWEPMPDGPVPGIVDLVRMAKRHAAAFYTWEPLRDLSRPGSLAYSCLKDIYWPFDEDSDLTIARLAADYLVRERPDFVFIYLGWTDEIGHRHGWMSSEYLHAIAGADAAIGHVLERLEGAGLASGAAYLLLSDHGGHDRAHGTDCAEDMTIPWVLQAPGIRRGYEVKGKIRIYDTAPTIARLLGLECPEIWQGQPVSEAWEGSS